MSIALVYHLVKLLRNQWLTKQELEQLQQRKLQKIIKHAYEKVSYYHKLFNSAGIKPEDIRSKKDLRYIPITSRTRIQSLATKEIVAQGVRLSNCHHVKTSGSTGIPLEILKTKKEYQLFNLVVMRSFLANGYRLTISKLPLSAQQMHTDIGSNTWVSCGKTASLRLKIRTVRLDN